MSRIGRWPIPLPQGVSVELDGSELRVRGPKGTLSERLPSPITVEIEERQVRFGRRSDRRPVRALHGLARALTANMVTGVTQGFRRELEIQGVGYRAEVQGRKLTLTVGYSHPVVMEVPEGLQVTVEANTRLRIEGLSRQRVGQFAADVRAVRPPEPYKGKGIRYADERIRRKVGKAGTT